MPTNEELIKKLSKDLRDYIEDRIGSVIDLVINQAETVDRTRRDADALATKLRDVTAALVQADGAILLDLQDLRTFVMNSAFGEPLPVESYLTDDDIAIINEPDTMPPPNYPLNWDTFEVEPGHAPQSLVFKFKRFVSRAR